jgi:uncharacterized membrane protein
MKTSSRIQAITQHNVEEIAKLEEIATTGRTLGERVADFATKTVGSWPFLIVQSILLIFWMILNVLPILRPWDPYPFILLNLVLSFQAAFATPIILMSGNRQARLSERRNELDLQINLLAEQENTEQLRLLRLLCEKAGIPLKNSEAPVFEEAIKPDTIVQQMADIAEKFGGNNK